MCRKCTGRPHRKYIEIQRRPTSETAPTTQVTARKRDVKEFGGTIAAWRFGKGDDELIGGVGDKLKQ